MRHSDFLLWPKAQKSLMIFPLSFQTLSSDIEHKVLTCNSISMQSRLQMTCLSKGKSKTNKKVTFASWKSILGKLYVSPPHPHPQIFFFLLFKSERDEKENTKNRRGEKIFENWPNKMWRFKNVVNGSRERSVTAKGKVVGVNTHF